MTIPKRVEGLREFSMQPFPTVPFRGGVAPIMVNFHLRFSASWVFDTEFQAHPAMFM